MDDTLAGVTRAALLAFAALLPIINPAGLAPIFLSMTPGAPDAIRTTLARRIARNAFALLTAAAVAGSYVLLFFGLSLAVVKIAGGLLVVATAWHLVRAEQTPDSSLVAGQRAVSADHLATHGFYPLTFPLTVGPGSISVAVTLGASLRVHDVASLPAVLGSLGGIALVSLAVYLSYRFAARLLRVLGHTGTAILLRLSAFILLAIGVQILCDGLVERFGVAPRP
jgi:multiple antibiotic resistance protein